MDDLVNKQDVIEAMCEAFSYAYCDNCENGVNDKWEMCDGCHRKYQNWRVSKKVVEETINGLPSAQPERGNDSMWKLFDLITSAYHGKQYYFPQNNGLVYSRASNEYMSVNDAIREFLKEISNGCFNQQTRCD